MRLAERVAAGELSAAELADAVEVAAERPTVDLGYARVDAARGLRTGVSEVIYGAGKTASQITGIVRAMRGAGQERVLITRLDAEKAAVVRAGLAGEACGTGDGPAPGRELGGAARSAPVSLDYRADARLGIVGGMRPADGAGEVLVLAAGTSDLPVAEEAALTAEFLGNRVRRVYDVGVAGIHRLLAHVGDIQRARVIVAVAGMEGALPSVVAGLAACPVIAVPTSVGYGASFGGVTALLAMLNSCASGVSVVNIDNGFGAAFQASLINHL